ncbi:hypothetical protein ILUMI_26883 [Ignelater luminosus]|uniref:Uncharacterized protein n=1 Tax=Ignelater luminosus TaxID=2038154 RepID=A0A8K0C625_IGNLU|nr:hypothetical protein ILUMI_26883 [Ignelater luminosus]
MLVAKGYKRILSSMLTSRDEDPDDSDKDKNYQPELEEEFNDDTASVGTTNEDEEGNCKRPRKRLRKESEWKRYIKRERSEDIYTLVDCIDSISEQEQQEIVNKYWTLGSWNVQTSFLNSCIGKMPIKRHNQDAVNQKTSSSCITLKGHRVCKKFFLQTLDISNKRFSNVLKKKTADGIVQTDKRDQHSPANKLLPTQIDFVKRHIKLFPKFKSHYSRKHNPNRQYLDSSLNINKMYRLYKELCQTEEEVPVKIHMYRFIFNTCFNLSFHKPYTDTCTTCDQLNNTIQNSSQEMKHDATVSKEIHLKKAEAARGAKRTAKELAVASSNRVAFSFDLQKTLPTPQLTCSKVYYLRQLWTYNFEIHNLATGTASMFLWSENDASRGSQEIMSFNEDIPFERIDLKKHPGRPAQIELPLLYKAPLKIKLLKYKNLMELLQFIPPIHHRFFKTLPYEKRGENGQDNDGTGVMKLAIDVEEDCEDDILESDYDGDD